MSSKKYAIRNMWSSFQAMKDVVRYEVEFFDVAKGQTKYVIVDVPYEDLMDILKNGPASYAESAMAKYVSDLLTDQVGDDDFIVAMFEYFQKVKNTDKNAFTPNTSKGKSGLSNHASGLSIDYDMSDKNNHTLMKKYLEENYGGDKIVPLEIETYYDASTGMIHYKPVEQKPSFKSGKKQQSIETQVDNTLPGLNEACVHPVTHEQTTVKYAIINLNDHHKWTREQVADWLETLDVDLRFKSPDAILREQKEKELATLREQLVGMNKSIAQAEENLIDMKASAEALSTTLTTLMEEINEQS